MLLIFLEQKKASYSCLRRSWPHLVRVSGGLLATTALLVEEHGVVVAVLMCLGLVVAAALLQVKRVDSAVLGRGKVVVTAALLGFDVILATTLLDDVSLVACKGRGCTKKADADQQSCKDLGHGRSPVVWFACLGSSLASLPFDRSDLDLKDAILLC